MPAIKSLKDRELARKLRIVDKKSFGEISELTGIAKSTLFRWAKSENWPDPQEEKRKLNQIFYPEKRKLASEVSAEVTGLTQEFMATLPEVDFNANMEVLAEQLFRWAATVLKGAAKHSLPATVKLLEVSARIVCALYTPRPPEIRKLTVMIPGTVETYRQPPEDEK